VKPVQTAPPPPTEPAIEAALPPVPRATTAAEARAQREEFERRPPDARFLRAIEHLALLSAAAAVPPVEAKLRDGKWSLVQGPTTLATVAAWPGFKELLDPVVSRAGEARAAAAPAPGALPLLIGDALVGELDAVNALWSAGDRSPAFLGRAAHALVSAAFEIYDAMGIVDAVPARAIALAAMAKRAGALPTADEALLAELLGYEREARALAGPLPAGNPVRAYVLREDAALEARAGGKDSSLTDRYLWTRRLSALGDEGRSQSWMGELGPELQTPAFLEAFLRSGTFSGLGVGADLAQAELSAILARARIKPEDLATRPGAPADHPPRLAEMAELALAALPDARGVPFDVDLERAVARARIASAVDGMLRGQIARYSDPANAAGVLQFLGSAPPGPLRDVEAWVYSIVNRYKGRDGFNRLEKLLEVGLGSLGGEALARYLDQGAGGMPAQYGLLRLTRFVARRMDTRPSHRQALLGLLFARTFDRAWQERMARRQLEVLDAERTRGWLAMLDGDWATAERMASDPRRAPADRIADLWQLYEAGRLDAKAASKRMRAIADGAPDDYAATDKYEDFLEDLWRWEDMVSFLGPWVKRHAGEDTIQTAK
jgi:hypothetical protein